MKTANDIVMKFLGALLIIAAVLKGWQLVSEPIANNSIWAWRPFLILQVDFELALGIWFLFGLFRKAAWLVGLLCFTCFSLVTLYKGITGAESCGCFGSVHVNPWITLFVVDLPAVIALTIFRPKGEKLFSRPSIPRFVTAACIGLVTLGAATPILALNEPDKKSYLYEVLEPKTWVGKELPILESIDIAESLKEGRWLILLYHYDCPECRRAIVMYEQIAKYLTENKDFLQITIIEVPPYGIALVSENSRCIFGRLANTKDWFVTTPAAVLIENSKVRNVWEGKTPDLESVISIAILKPV